MIRNTAREIAVHLAYELSFTDKTVEELLDERLTKEYFDTLKDEDDIYEKAPGAAQTEYIRSIVSGVAEHAPELDGYIAKYAKGWSFDRIPLVASAIMRVAMYESLYRSDIPTRVAVNEAVEMTKRHRREKAAGMVNAILRKFAANREDMPPLPKGSPAQTLSLRYSHPGGWWSVCFPSSARRRRRRISV